MVFTWQVPYSNDTLAGTFRDKALDMYRNEVRYRAGLLARLGYGKDEVASRCRSYMSWDYELTGKHPVVGEIESLVGEVYSRHHLNGGAGKEATKKTSK